VYKGTKKLTTKPVTVRLNKELHAKVAAISHVTGITIRQIVEDGLEHEVMVFLCDDRIERAVKAMLEYYE